MVYEAILQALELLNSECNDYRNNTGTEIDQSSFRIQLVEVLFVKYAMLTITVIVLLKCQEL
jgi:hypothetical protein